MLTAYFEKNMMDEKARGILYRDFPEFYTWVAMVKEWNERATKRIGQVGRIISANPAEGERYYLRVLLNHMAGDTSFDDLRTVDGVTLPTFREAAERRVLIEADNTLNEEQRAAYDEIMSAINTKHGRLFFIDGPGGMGKTYLYKALLATIRS
jgi:primosomal protein N'